MKNDFCSVQAFIFFLIYSLIKLYSMTLTPSEHEELSFVFLWIFFVCLNLIAMKIIIFQNSLKTYKNMTWIFCKLIWPNKMMRAAFMIWLEKKAKFNTKRGLFIFPFSSVLNVLFIDSPFGPLSYNIMQRRYKESINDIRCFMKKW